jgi:hypothetical protein
MSPLCRWLLKNRLRLAEVLLKKAVDGEIVFLPGHVMRDILIQQVFNKSPLFLQQAEVCSRHREQTWFSDVRKEGVAVAYDSTTHARHDWGRCQALRTARERNFL